MARMTFKTDKPRIEDVLGDALQKVTGANWVREYKPSDLRAWKIDLALPSIRLAVEIEGRFHGRAKVHVNDCEKFNFMVAAGWRVLRYPASRVQTKVRREKIVEQIHRIMCDVCDCELDAEVLSG